MLTYEQFKKIQDIPSIVIDKDGIIVYINKVFTNKYGWKEDDLLGKNLSLIIPEELREAHSVGMARFMVTETPRILGKPIQLSLLTKSKEVLTVSHTIYADKIKDKWIFYATIG